MSVNPSNQNTAPSSASYTPVQKCLISTTAISVALLVLASFALAGILSPASAFGTLGDDFGILGTSLLFGIGSSGLIALALDYCMHNKSGDQIATSTESHVSQPKKEKSFRLWRHGFPTSF